MANVSFPVWWVTAIPAQYSGSGTVTVSRSGTATTATVTATLTMNYLGGDWLSHTAHMRIGSGTPVSVTGAGGVHYEGSSETFTLTQTISAADAGGSVTVYVWLTADGYEGEPSSTQSVTLTYPGRTTYTISYNANGGSGAPGSQTKYYGANITLSSTRPTRSGYAFVRWNTAANGSGTNYNPGATYSANASVTLYAQWTRTTFTVSYNANGGSGAPGAQTKYNGVNLTLTSAKPTRTGYTFVRWNTAANGSGTNYYPGGTYSANASVTLYAIWQLITYTVSYNANGGSGAPSAQTKNYNSTIQLSTTRPTRSNYQFKCWNTNAAGTGTNYNPGGTYTGNSNLTLYAVWTPMYSLSFNGNGGTGAPEAVFGVAGATVTIPNTTPTKEGTTSTFTVTYDKVEEDATISKTSEEVTVYNTYSFVRWNTNSNGSGISYYPGQTFKLPSSNTVLYAIYGFAQNGTTELPTGTRTQYVLSGFSESLEDITLVSDPYMPTKNVTLHAVWSPQSPGGYLKFQSNIGLPGMQQGKKIFLTGFHDKRNDGPYTVDSYNWDGTYVEMTFVEDFASAGSQQAGSERLKILGTGNYVPDMDYICSLNNRLWGCSSVLRTIYASALGDPTDFWTFAGDSLDAYQVAVGSSGDFTGCAAMNNNVLFFKQHCIHKIVGNYPAEYALYTYDADGTSKSNGLSAINCDGVVIYVAEHGMSTYSGSTAGTLSKELGEGNMNNAIAMFNGEKYFLHYNADDMSRKTYIFDTRYNVWVQVDYKEVLAMMHLDDHDYALIRNNEGTRVAAYDSDGNFLWDNQGVDALEIYDEDDTKVYDSTTDDGMLKIYDPYENLLYPVDLFYGTIYQIDTGEPTDGDWEIVFKAIYEDLSGNWGSKSHVFEKKRYTGITFRMELPVGSWIQAELKGDDGRWRPIARKAGKHNGVDDFVVRTGRLDRMQLRLSGHGPMTILGMEREYTIGSRR